jgi:hypothetical protein
MPQPKKEMDRKLEDKVAQGIPGRTRALSLLRISVRRSFFRFSPGLGNLAESMLMGAKHPRARSARLENFEHLYRGKTINLLSLLL